MIEDGNKAPESTEFSEIVIEPRQSASLIVLDTEFFIGAQKLAFSWMLK